MNNKQQPTVRLVKCPRCSELLPEPEHVPLYTCGGCGTTLKAKYYKGHDKDISHGRDVTRTNGMVHERNGRGSSSSSRRSSSSTEHVASLDRGRDQVEDSERNTAVYSSDDTSLSKDSAFLKNKENGVIENKMDCSDSNDLDKRRDEDAEKSFSSPEQNGAASSSHHTELPECSSIERKKAREISNKDDQFNPNEPEQHTMAKSATGHNVQDEIVVDNNQKKQIGDVNIGLGTFAQEDSHALEKKEAQKPAIARESIEDEGDHEQKKIGYVASSALNDLSDVKNPVLPDASDHEVSEETREIHHEGKYPHQNQQQQQQNQVGYVNSAKEASSLVESSAIMNSAESLDNEVSKDSRKMLLVEEHSHQYQDEQRQTEYVNSSKESSSLAIENSVGPHASNHKVCEETKEMSLTGKHFHQDQNEQKQVGVVDSAIDADSLSDAPPIKNLTECPDYEVSEPTTKIHLIGKHPHQEKHDSSNDTSSLMVSSAIENLVEHDAPDHQVSEEAKKKHLEGNDSQQDQTEQRQDHEVSEETKKTHLVGKDSQQDQAEQRQDPTKDTSSRTNSVIKKLTPLASANSVDASDFEVSGGRRKMDLSGEHSHQDISGSESNRFGVDEPGELENSGKESCSGRDVNNFVECKVEQRGEVKSNEITQGGNESASVPSNANNLKTSPDMGTTEVLRDARNEISDHGKRTSKQNVKKFRDTAVYSDAEVGNSLREFPRHPSKRSPAYDSSVSSFDGNDDQGTERPARVGEETLSPNNAVAGYDGAEESPEWTNSLPERIMYRSNSRVQTQAKSASSVQLDKKLKNSMVERGGTLEEEYDIRRKINRYRPERDSFIPRVPNRRRSSEIGFETGSSSSYAPHDEPPSHQMPPHPFRRRFHDVSHWRGKEFLPAYYNSETSGEIYDRPGHRAYVDGRRQAENWSQSGTLPRIPYSGEMINPRHPYMYRYPDYRRWSAQLPPPAVCCHQGAYMGPAWEPRWDPYDSYPTSPQRYVESESSYAWGHDTISLSDDQRHKDQIMRRLYLREKRQALKRQFHPTAGGAPFISCYSCFNILQLPKDFLISSRRRRTHKLQCGACSSVLEFSLENESSLARYETNIDRNANQVVSSSHVHHSRHSSLNSADSRELLSHDSFKASNRENRKLSHGGSRRGEGMEGELDDDDNAAPGRGRPTKVSWQLPASSKSPLHRLMGYSSPKDLLSMHEANDLQ